MAQTDPSSDNSKKNEPKESQGQAIDEAQATELINQLKELVLELKKPKKKDYLPWVTIAVSFLSTVVVTGLSLYFSNRQSERNHQLSQQQSERTHQYDLLQLELKERETRVAELKALNELLPSITSQDTNTRKVAFGLLEAALPKKSIATPSANNNDTTENNVASSLISQFYVLAKVAMSPTAPTEHRKDALVKIGQVASSRETPKEIKEKAVEVVVQVASSPDTPEPLRRTADEVLAGIKRLTSTQLAELIRSEPLSRQVENIILHHAGSPVSKSKYNGANTLLSLAKMQVNNFQWNNVSWHYAIAPDGSVWLGAPLNQAAIHTPKQNKTSVSILLIMDGEIELPSDKQKATLRELLNLLYQKANLGSDSVHPHRFYQKDKICPGKLLTDIYIDELTK